MEPYGFGDTTPFDYGKQESNTDGATICFPQIEYNIYGILNFLQTEWSKMSIERSRWEYDRAELEAKIALLQNEKNGQENLKNDLVRRIKMLEYALKQERYKNFNIKFPNENHRTTEIHQDSVQDATSFSDRTRLREYLAQIGLGRLSSELRAAKVKEFLNISESPSDFDVKTIESALADFSFLSDSNNTGAENTVLGDSVSDQKETDDALAEFDRLVAQQGDCFGEATNADSLVDTFTPDVLEPPKNWASGDQSAFVDRLKEQYRLGLPVNRGPGLSRPKSADQPPTSSSLSPPPPHAYDEMELFSAQGRIPTSEDVLLLGKAVGEQGGLGDLASLTSASALDNLDGVVQQQQSAVLASADEPKNVCTPPPPPAWTAKYTLRSHFDAIRAVVFHHTEQILLTGSEDCTLRLWSLAKRVQAKKSSCLDVEPMYTCRGHTTPVLCVAMLSVGVQNPEIGASRDNSPLTTALETSIAFSGSLDGEIRTWHLGSLQLMLYDNFDPSVGGPILKGHADAVWSLAVRCDGALLSASADGTVQLWQTLPTLAQPPPRAFVRDTTTLSSSRVYRPGQTISSASGGSAVPTSVEFLLPSANNSAEVEAKLSNGAFVVGLTSGDVVVMGLNSGRQIYRFEPNISTKPDHTLGPPGSVNALCVHPSLPLVISAHENRQIRFLDTAAGVCLSSMVAHLEGVNALAIDPQGIYLVSASHDSSIRLWDVESRTCVQEFTSHRKKHDESIHSVAFHPTQPLIASAGADGLAKVYV